MSKTTRTSNIVTLKQPAKASDLPKELDQEAALDRGSVTTRIYGLSELTHTEPKFKLGDTVFAELAMEADLKEIQAPVRMECVVAGVFQQPGYIGYRLGFKTENHDVLVDDVFVEESHLHTSCEGKAPGPEDNRLQRLALVAV